MESAPEHNRIHLSINSPGGDFYDGIGIYNMLASQDLPVAVSIPGLAASAASIIAMAGDTVEIAATASFMIHEASTLIYGNAAALREAIDAMETIGGMMASVYAERSGGDEEEIRKWMRAETYFTGEEAVERGFADTIMKKRGGKDSMAVPAAKSSAKAGTDLSRMREWLASRRAEVRSG